MNPADARTDKVNLRWRHDLLSSSVQLEYRVARRVVEHGFSAAADYSYARISNGLEKEYSVDLLAQHILWQGDNDAPENIGDVKLLAECKYRRPGVSWLFLPEFVETNVSTRIPIVRTISAFSNTVGARLLPDLSLPRCYKGVEIDLGSRERNRVTDQELRHGLEQLQFALVPMLTEVVQGAAVDLAYDEGVSPPVFMLPVLVTTAPLYVAANNFDDVDLLSVDSIEQFAALVPMLTIDMVVGTQLSAEVRRQFQTLDDSVVEAFNHLDAVRKSHKGLAPVAAMTYRTMRNASSFRMRQLLSRFVVCNIDHFDQLLSDFDEVVGNRASEVMPLVPVATT